MRRADEGVLGGEPLFRVLREQHPDVDLVILPPVDAAQPEQSLAAAPDVATTVRAARAALDGLLEAIGHPDPDARHEAWRFENSAFVRTFVVRASLRGLPEGEAVPLLRRIGDTLLAQGWDARAVVDRPAELLASDGRHLLDAEVAAGSIDLRLESMSLAAAPETIDAVTETLR
ncbi:hypothetical protein GEV29_15830 [Aeromicrobium sp. SMF47]|uniref:Uncharacterized protein n=1 Tax=Aeromicrobium yanjiei TaxID=2662028 RepID=A0A5Q2MIR8_9ACTN|nr:MULTISPECIES: hypothetical protein [Aeromicrobium]MRJ78007.1 hypothetical protein [Aeromicrobium yanjiei]MRK02367.1 hypothetical protein [Aeromicrobium sp. S22]QGG40912.1 hypothetical protein GEV26_05800 [Aeromicrobium yanjiei]